MMCGGYVWGALSDIRGRKYILITALLFNALFAFLSGISQTYAQLLAFRLLSGIGYDLSCLKSMFSLIALNLSIKK
jgi:MFS family permease